MRSRHAAGVAALCCLLAACGYVGDPLPPALNIAAQVTDLRAVEYGDRIIVDFTIQPLTTEGLTLNYLGDIDLRIGSTDAPFDASRWAASAKRVSVTASAAGPVRANASAADLIGKQVVIGVRLINKRGRASTWSNLVSLDVVQPVAAPRDVTAEPAPNGARLKWTSPERSFRVFRRTPEQKEPELIGNSDRPEYVDAAAKYGVTYEYLVQAIRGSAESDLPPAVTVIPRDVFPPAPPAGLSAVAGLNSVELVWERNTESDLKGYRVYRAAANGEFEVLAEFIDAPAYSDRQVDAGKRYRYAVTAIDQANNESKKSATVEITAP